MTIHKFYSTGEAYDATQCNEDIRTGDILVIEREGVVGIADTWPIAVTPRAGHLHTLAAGSTFADYAGGKLQPFVAAAQAEAAKLVEPPEGYAEKNATNHGEF